MSGKIMLCHKLSSKLGSQPTTKRCSMRASQVSWLQYQSQRMPGLQGREGRGGDRARQGRAGQDRANTWLSGGRGGQADQMEGLG